MRFLKALLLFSCLMNVVSAQNKNDSIRQVMSEVDLLKKLKITGYLQMQFQKASSDGIATIYGGNFSQNISSRLMLRRGRLKAEYTSELSKFVLQVAASDEKVNLDEVYVLFKDPWFKVISLKTGIFDRPFGFEVPYSSSKLEYDERSRINRSILPSEKDMGVMVSLQLPEKSALHFISIDAGLFNGTGPANKDFDDRKDFIGHLKFDIPFKSELLKVNCGLSYYRGGFDNQRTYHYKWSDGFVEVPNDSLSIAKNEHKGIDAQIGVNWALGKAQFRAEYIYGEQAGTSSSTSTPNVAPSDKNSKPIPSYLRKYNGGYFVYIQNILKTNIQFILKYDWFDPNTNASGGDIGNLQNTGIADIKYSTTGVGLSYEYNEHLKLLAYYDFVMNESTNLSGFTKDVDDDIFTLRLQYKF